MEEETFKGVQTIVFDDDYFLILYRKGSWEGWEFPKGLLNDGESEEDAVLREVFEETGLKNVKVSKKIDAVRDITSPNGKKCQLSVYLVRANMNVPVVINKEHVNYLWTRKESVLEKLKWADEKGVFMKALGALGNV